MTADPPIFTVAVIGGGFSGTLLALKALAGLPTVRIVVIDDAPRTGRGVAYGACSPVHLLNVPVSRIEVGLEPHFATWLGASGADLAAALAESGGDLDAAFVQRALFGDYLQAQLQAALRTSPRLSVLHARAVALEESPVRAIVLDDGRRVAADAVVLATGNLPPPPLRADAIAGGSVAVSDPWARDARASLASDAPVLLVGTGLTMVDVALDLARSGHTGPMLAVSRHGFLPQAHAGGGQWVPFIDTSHDTPLRALKAIRTAATQAAAQDIPWQRVIDAVRPAVARLWHDWSMRHRRQFIRHLRARWTMVRHRMAPRIAQEMQALVDSGRLRILAGRLGEAERHAEGIAVEIVKRGGGRERFIAAHVVNCTGPRTDYATLEQPLLADLRRRDLIVPDPLGLGIETDDCAAVDARGLVSTWLFAVGAPTVPAWWEITAVPEIALQIGRLVPDLLAAREGRVQKRVLLSEEFNDLGAGI
jgi:uncharacterized NAD(P)/FAD-binding protein YdhS